MPQKRNSPPPPVMTLSKAMPVLIVAGVFDLAKMFFNMFWFFGPAIAAIYCASKVNSLVGSLGGLADTACKTVATAAGTFFSPVLASFGTVMADASALFGFLTIGLLIFMTNSRILKTVRTAKMQITASFLVGAIPLIGALPSFAPTVYKLYRRQIKLETAAYAKWEKENAEAQAQQRNQQMAQQGAQIQATEQARAQREQFMQREAANDARYNQDQAANDEQYTNNKINEEARNVA